MTLRVAVVTSSRADWSHLRRPVAAFHDHSELEPILVATAAMVDHDYGSAIAEVEAEGYEVRHRIPCLGGDRDVDMAASGGRAQLGFAQCFAELRPDVALVTADRFEMLAPAIAAMTMRIPIIHIEGGEASLGVIDHAIRNALTQLASIHMVTTTKAAHRLRRMGEEMWRIHQVGAASLDTFVHDPDVEDEAVSQAVGQPVGASTILVAVHPVTLDEDPIAQGRAVFTALENIDAPMVVCFPNADAGGRALREIGASFCAGRPNATQVVNLPPRIWWGCLRRASVLVGNSSSGVMESTTAGLPAIDVGNRQEGRERGANVLSVPAEPSAIRAALSQAQSEAFRASCQDTQSPYGDGTAAMKMAKILADL
ncbi:MAG: UDP-N-acetylglucosamine 2-epimerase, partial [Planctomycetota bacterium]|nr:UDP-N-acetylglucosamine 2-epimerase [Planctomycetota bacterium]